jgi:hypothetical protein
LLCRAIERSLSFAWFQTASLFVVAKRLFREIARSQRATLAAVYLRRAVNFMAQGFVQIARGGGVFETLRSLLLKSNAIFTRNRLKAPTAV